jgi:hypothetical protein
MTTNFYKVSLHKIQGLAINMRIKKTEGGGIVLMKTDQFIHETLSKTEAYRALLSVVTRASL